MDEQTTGMIAGGIAGLLISAVIGLLIGVTAKMVVPGPDPGGWFATLLLGIAGAWIGGLAVGALGVGGAVPGLIAAVLGAVLLLLLYRVIKKR